MAGPAALGTVVRHIRVARGRLPESSHSARLPVLAAGLHTVQAGPAHDGAFDRGPCAVPRSSDRRIRWNPSTGSESAKGFAQAPAAEGCVAISDREAGDGAE